MKILFTGGGTAGHIIPIIAINREIRRIYPAKNIQLLYIGPKDEFSSILLSQEEIGIKHIFAGKIRRYSDIKNICQNSIDILFKIPIGIIQAFFYIFFLNPDLIFSKGGFGSIPAIIAGWLLQVPIFLHESDVTPGLSNKFLSRLALIVFVSFPRTEYFSSKKMILIGNPIRKEILEGSNEEAKKLFKLKGEKPLILILGGSQGAQRINDKILENLPNLLENFEIIHQCGDKNFREIKNEIEAIISKDLKLNYHLFPFLKEGEIRRAYYAADLILSRAGSGSIFEIAACAKPSILIPLAKSAQNHQVKNAYSYAASGACLVLEEANFTSGFFFEKLKYLFSHYEELKKMSQRAKEFSRPKAAKIIAEYIVEYLK